MKAGNKQMDLQKMQNTMMQFQQESMKMDMKEEMMNDTIDGLDEDEDEDESENVMNQVLDEIGISIGQDVSVTFVMTPKGTDAFTYLAGCIGTNAHNFCVTSRCHMLTKESYPHPQLKLPWMKTTHS